LKRYYYGANEEQPQQSKDSEGRVTTATMVPVYKDYYEYCKRDVFLFDDYLFSDGIEVERDFRRRKLFRLVWNEKIESKATEKTTKSQEERGRKKRKTKQEKNDAHKEKKSVTSMR
jgi:hypothetical protein